MSVYSVYLYFIISIVVIWYLQGMDYYTATLETLPKVTLRVIWYLSQYQMCSVVVGVKGHQVHLSRPPASVASFGLSILFAYTNKIGIDVNDDREP